MLETDLNPGPFYIVDNSFVSKRKHPWLYATFDLYHYCRNNDLVFNFYSEWIDYDRIQLTSAMTMLLRVNRAAYPMDRMVYLRTEGELGTNIKYFDSSIFHDFSNVFICDHGCDFLDRVEDFNARYPNGNYMVFYYSYNTFKILLNRLKMLRMFVNKLEEYGMYDYRDSVDIAKITLLLFSFCSCGETIEHPQCIHPEE